MFSTLLVNYNTTFYRFKVRLNSHKRVPQPLSILERNIILVAQFSVVKPFSNCSRSFKFDELWRRQVQYCWIQKVAIIFQRRFLAQSHFKRRDNVHGSPSGGLGGCPHEEPFLEFSSVGCAPVSHLYRARVRLQAVRTRLGSPLRYRSRQKLLEKVAGSKP